MLVGKLFYEINKHGIIKENNSLNSSKLISKKEVTQIITRETNLVFNQTGINNNIHQLIFLLMFNRKLPNSQA